MFRISRMARMLDVSRIFTLFDDRKEKKKGEGILKTPDGNPTSEKKKVTFREDEIVSQNIKFRLKILL